MKVFYNISFNGFYPVGAAAVVKADTAEEAAALLEEERKTINKRFAQDKATLIKDLTDKFNREKHIAMEKYETELRDKLYAEMVKQKDYIQHKFASAQEAALQEHAFQPTTPNQPSLFG